MSINVTVHGNPVCIKRGKMVALDGNKEFELRRKIRIQQVRQQSKKIAEEVRNKVKKEKTKQINKLGNEVQAEFIEKQNKKLTSLKQHHRGCLRDFGRAFGDAEIEPDPDEVIKQINDENRHQAHLRGKTAEQRLHNDKENIGKGKNKHIADRKYARYVEKVRSKLVADLSKSKNKRKRHANIKICESEEDINVEEYENREECINLDEDNDGSVLGSDIFNLSVLNESIASESFNEDNIKSTCKEPMSYIQYKKKLCGNNNSDIEIEDESEEVSRNVERSTSYNFPVCGKDNSSKDTITNHSYDNYKKKNTPSSLKSEQLAAIADSIIKIAEEFKDENRDIETNYESDSCDNAPCEKVLKDMFDETTSIKRRQRCGTDNTPCLCDPQNFCCSNGQVDTNTEKKKKLPDKFNMRQSVQNFSDNDILQYPTRPVLKSESISPTKHIRRDFHKFPHAAETPLPFRKTLISSKKNMKKCDPALETEFIKIIPPIKIPQSTKKTTKAKLSKKKSSIHDSNYCMPTVSQNNKKIHESDFQLPDVPTTYIRPEYDSDTARETNVKYYDHFNRFSKDELQPALVQKISKESINVISDNVSDVDQQYTLCKKREQEAKIRGNKALEKVKIHQDYEKLLQELPILQRQERLANMPMHNPASHMTNERYQEYERKKQNILENKFENMHSKAVQFNVPPITLKSVQKAPPSKNEPLKTLDITDENAILNVGNWEKVTSPTCSDQQFSNGVSEQYVDDENSEQDIANLLKRINKQRELLLKEAVTMKSLGPLKDILNDEELINIICNCPPRPKVLVETGTSPLSKHFFEPEKPKIQSKSSLSKSPKRSAVSSSDTSVEVCRSKPSVVKPKVKKLKIYLREEATQTSPLASSKSLPATCAEKTDLQASKSSRSTSSHKSKVRRSKSQRSLSSSKTLVIPKNKNVEQPSSSDKSNQVCEIIIRTGDQNVKINPKTSPGKSTGRNESAKKDVIIKIKEGKGDYVQPNALEISASTSYLSPPLLYENKGKPSAPTLSGVGTSRPSNRHLLQPQKQQTNLDNLVKVENGSKEINPRLIKYIMRLLNMSRQSIDDLTISSVSEVSTPQESIIQTANNVAKEKLQTVMDHFNLSADDIKKFCLSSSSLSDLTNQEVKTNSEHDKKQSGPAKQFVCASTSTRQDEAVQINMNEDKTASSTDSRCFGSNKKQNTSLSTSSGYVDSNSKSPRITVSKNNVIYPKTDDSKSCGLQSKDTCRKHTSSSPISDFRPCSPKSTTLTSTTPPKNTCIKIALPKMDSTSEQCSTEINTLPSSTKQTNLQKVSPTNSRSPIKQEATISKYGTSDTSSEDIMLKNPEKFLQFVRESLGMSVEEFSELGFEEMFSRHMELTEYCHDRIKSLMNLIQQIRNEKRDICSSSSPIDHSVTSYLELPSSKSKQTNVKDTSDQGYTACVQSCLENEVSSASSISQDAIDKYLLGIGNDVELNGTKIEKDDNQNEKTVKFRLQSGETKEETQPSFIPMLQGIPKFTQGCVVDAKIPNFLGNLLDQIRPKPPPALLRSNMRGHTNEIPHELSTIVEADTLLSSKNTSAYRPRSPEERMPSRDVSPRSVLVSPKDKKSSPKKTEMNKSAEQSNSINSSVAYITISPERTIPDESKKGQKKIVKSVVYNTSDSTPENDSGPKSGLSGIHSLSETSQETADELEAMLRKFKLEWAISLVKKTEQALALSSSSSSSDVKGKKDGSSDVSLRESFKHLCKKLASLNESDIERAQIVSDLSQHFREFHDISEIPGVADSKNKSHQRTSTPVQHSKSTESKKSNTNESLFKVDSELSSVKNTSDENHDQLFLSIPNITLNTEHISLIK